MDANALYRELLAGNLSAEQKAGFAARLRDDADFAATLEADEDELLLVTRLLWAQGGGYDSCAPRFAPDRANAAARQGVVERSRGRSRVLLLAGTALAAAALAFFLVPRGAPAEAEDLDPRGALATVGVAVDWLIDDEPLLSKDTVAADAKVHAEWTNPKGEFSHLALEAEDAAGKRHPLRGAAPIGAVGVDDPVDPAGPFALPPGTVKLCGVFSKGPAAEGVRVCTEQLRLR